jgi:hypothetical protein
VLLCSEEDPRQCHRHLLIAHALLGRGWPPSRIIHLRRHGPPVTEATLAHQFGLALEGERPWKSPQSVLHKVLPSTSSSD